jgi:hypothetical protein
VGSIVVFGAAVVGVGVATGEVAVVFSVGEVAARVELLLGATLAAVVVVAGISSRAPCDVVVGGTVEAVEGAVVTVGV